MTAPFRNEDAGIPGEVEGWLMRRVPAVTNLTACETEIQHVPTSLGIHVPERGADPGKEKTLH